jgi:hypothetical protein
VKSKQKKIKTNITQIDLELLGRGKIKNSKPVVTKQKNIVKKQYLKVRGDDL